MSERSPDDRRPKEEEDLPPLPEDGVRKDLRFSKHEDLGVEVKRDLSGSGWLARGDNTRMSKLSFRMGPPPQTSRPDPDVETPRASRAATPPSPPAPEPSPPPVETMVPLPAEPEEPGPIGKFLGKIFGRTNGT